MKTLWEIMSWVSQKDRFIKISDYIEFSKYYLEFISSELQAEIIAQNENNYRFFQYKRDGEYNITRPVNEDLFLRLSDYDSIGKVFEAMLENIRDIKNDELNRKYINDFIYTTQQSIGCALDALPSSKTNTSRKVNGDLFERLMQLIIKKLGFFIDSETLSINVPNSNEMMKYQNDIEIKVNGEIVAIGSVKTSSKDRVDKIFLDKLMYNRLTQTNTPHFAIFLHDVQRAGTEPDYKVGQTFLTGHFKAYTIGLNPLDGVYYCDLRPVMKTDKLLKEHIKSLDHLLCEDIWDFIN
ncbi:MAG: hypothetical protein SPE30_08025 [Candidatus Treponema excrementipullorum]|nr:hypothetical protein [Spirochaetia bacterium]MDY4466218.1 hypothetical protein [Candidatus Treponema excrementipullorum]